MEKRCFSNAVAYHLLENYILKHLKYQHIMLTQAFLSTEAKGHKTICTYTRIFKARWLHVNCLLEMISGTFQLKNHQENLTDEEVLVGRRPTVSHVAFC